MTARIERVLQVHTRYRQPGGEDRVVDAERDLLARSGIAVEQLIFDNTDIREAGSLLRLAHLVGSAVWARSAAEQVRAVIKSFEPDVVHVHNTFVIASPSVFWAANRQHIPVVHTLHNYRLVCPVATCYRDGLPCTDCVGRPVPWPGVLHACVRGSHAQSAVSAATLSVHRAVGTWRERIDRYIALTEFHRSILVRGGLPASKISVIPNFLEPDPGASSAERSGFVYVGRLAREKGIGTLLAAASQPGMIRVVGDGPEAAAVRRAAGTGRLVALGRRNAEDAHREVSSAIALLVPSHWFEGFPLVVVEAFAAGTPVIASRIGSLGEIVEDGITGLLVPPGDANALANALSWAADHPAEMRAMGAAARAEYEQRYRGAQHAAALMAVYAAAGSTVAAH